MKARPLQVLFDATHHGKYQFEDFASCDLESNFERVDWRSRVIYKPSKRLKAYHAFLNSFLFEHLPINPRVAFAYRKGASPAAAVAPHAKSRAFYQTDLTKFFDSITWPLIQRTILAGKAECPIEDLEMHLDQILRLVTVDGKLPIGFSTSPWISNACMKDFDDAFEEICQERKFTYTRYADDIIISCDDRAQLGDVDALLEELLDAKLGPEFEINSAKRKLTTIGRKVSVLGMTIFPSGQIGIAMETKKKIEYQLHFFIKDRKRLLEIFNQDMEGGIQQLAGHISHIHTADPSYLEKLRKKYGSTVIDSFLHRSAK